MSYKTIFKCDECGKEGINQNLLHGGPIIIKLTDAAGTIKNYGILGNNTHMCQECMQKLIEKLQPFHRGPKSHENASSN